MLTNNNGRKSRRGDRKYLQPFCSCFIVQQQIFSFTVNVRGAGVSLLGVLGGLLPQYDLRAWETARLEVKIFWRRFTNCDRRLKIQVHTVTNTITHCYKSYYVLTQIKVQTWNLSKILHRRIFRLKILHRQIHPGWHKVREPGNRVPR